MIEKTFAELLSGIFYIFNNQLQKNDRRGSLLWLLLWRNHKSLGPQPHLPNLWYHSSQYRRHLISQYNSQFHQPLQQLLQLLVQQPLPQSVHLIQEQRLLQQQQQQPFPPCVTSLEPTVQNTFHSLIPATKQLF